MKNPLNDKSETRLEKAIRKVHKLNDMELVKLVEVVDPNVAALYQLVNEQEEARARADRAKATVVDYSNGETWTTFKGDTFLIDDLDHEHLTNIYAMLKNRTQNTRIRADYIGHATARLIRGNVPTLEILDVVRGQLAVDSNDKLAETTLGKALLSLI
jgi:hypothetical protein